MADQLQGRIGVVIPAYREAESIAGLLREVLAQVPSAIVVVVDDTPDRSTVEAAESVGSPSVTVIHRRAKGGRGSAVLEGIAWLLARGCEQIVEMDADFSHPPGEIPALLRTARDRQLGLLIASRHMPGGEIRNWPMGRHVFSSLSNRLARLVLKIPIADYTNGFRVYSRTAAETLVQTCGRHGPGFIALSEILVNLYYRGFTIAEVPTVFVNRLRGESSLNVTEIRNAAVGLFTIGGLARDLRGQRHG